MDTQKMRGGIVCVTARSRSSGQSIMETRYKPNIRPYRPLSTVLGLTNKFKLDKSNRDSKQQRRKFTVFAL